LIVNKAIQQLIQMLLAETWEIAIGSGSTPAWVDNETLETEIARLTATASLGSTLITNDTVILEVAFTFPDPKTVSEIGVFNAGATPFMYCRDVISPITYPANQPIIVKENLLIGRE